jgi:hypothetical protein
MTPNYPMPTPEESEPQTPVVHERTSGDHSHPHEHPASTTSDGYVHVHSHHHSESAHHTHQHDARDVLAPRTPATDTSMRMRPQNQPVLNPAAARYPQDYLGR